MSASVQSPVYSALSADPDMIDLVREFVKNLKDRVASLEAAVADDNVQELSRQAHQLKGAGGAYGFDAIGAAAVELEQAAKAADTVEEVRDATTELISICRRATAAPAPS